MAKQPNEKLEKLIRAPCDNCDGQGWYYLAWKHPNREQAIAGCEQCFGSREQWKAVWKK
ncbi:MAG: hypothetical protein HWQ38_27080 [Nostoc sp. NMS7]|nr:hypothetical protein [Nostoc sp. NMS7]